MVQEASLDQAKESAALRPAKKKRRAKPAASSKLRRRVVAVSPERESS
jgi:hypothetical protein